MNAAKSWQQAERILCVRLDSMGDVLMTTPAIRALKESGGASRHITLLTSPAGAEVARLVPEIDDVIVYSAPWLKATEPRADSSPEYEMAERLRRCAFDAAAICTVYSQNPLPSAFLCYLAGIPLRLAHCHENPYQLLTDWLPDPEPNQLARHEVQRQLDLVAAVDFQAANEHLSLSIPVAVKARVIEMLLASKLDLQRPWIVVHPGASAPSRRYAPESFAHVARQLVVDKGCGVIFTGSEGEREVVESIRQAMGAPSYSFAGRLDLGELAALISLAPLLLSNNTGPVHLAAAVGTPVVDIYALTNPQHTPWGVANRVLNHDVPCKYCYQSVCPEGHHNCIRLVSPGMVVEAVCELLLETEAQRPLFPTSPAFEVMA